MPTYRYVGAGDGEPHVIVAERWERDGDVAVFFGVTSLDGNDEPPWPDHSAVRAGGVLATRTLAQIEVLSSR